MFKTAIHEADIPERMARTSCAANNKRFRVSPKKSVEREHLDNHSTLQPFSLCPSPKLFQTLDSSRNTRLLDIRTIDAVQNQLQEEYKDEMSVYLRNKLRHLAGKRKEDIACTRDFSQTLQNPELENNSQPTIGPLDQFYSTFRQKSRLKIEKGVDGAYLSNAKERVTRLIHRQREQKLDFKELNLSIKVRQQQAQQRRARSMKDQFKMPLVESEQWDKSWGDESIKEKKRYRNRLLVKFKAEAPTVWLAGLGR